MYILLNTQNGYYFSGLYPPKYEPKFIQPVGSFNCVIFDSLEAVKEVQASITQETSILTLTINS